MIMLWHHYALLCPKICHGSFVYRTLHVSCHEGLCVCEILFATTCLVKESHTVSLDGVGLHLSVLSVSYIHTYSTEHRAESFLRS